MAELTITGSSVLSDNGGAGGPKLVTAGATVTRGQPVYKDTADSNEYKPCISTVQASAVAEGIALCDSFDGHPLLISRDGDIITIGATVALGEEYCVSGTLGKLELTSDIASTEWVTHIGAAVSTTQIKQNIVVTGAQHA